MAASPTIGMLRPALELAWVVAKVGDQARPAIPAPGRLRPLMRFAKLPDRALTTVRQVVDDDGDFRLRVAEIADETVVGRAGWLWLVRPDGWEEDLGALAQAADVAASEVQGEKEERSARRRLAAAEAAMARAEAEAARLRDVNASLVAEISSERQARRGAEDERARVEASRASSQSERDRMGAAVAALESQIASLRQEADEAAGRAATAGRDRDAARAESRRLVAELNAAGTEAERLSSSGERLREGVGDAIWRAATAAQELAAALAEVATVVRDGDATPRGAASDPKDGVSPLAPAEPGGGAAPAWRVVGPRRRPVSLPPAVFDDSIEAAQHLMRVTGILLVVDGYNVTLSSWPDLDLPLQRHRLVDALAELAMRSGPSVHVVFDGVEGPGRFDAPAAARRKMRVTFSPEGVDADEVIIELVEQVKPAQPVVVATDDRRVQSEVRRRGANVISVTQLLAVLGRAPGSVAG